MSKTSKRRFWGRLRSLGYSTYNEYLASDHWRDVRVRFFASRARRRCASKGCISPATQLHHRTYKRLGSEYLRDLYGLCEKHHREIHAAEAFMPERWGLFSISKAVVKHPGIVEKMRRQKAKRVSNASELAGLIKEQAKEMTRRR